MPTNRFVIEGSQINDIPSFYDEVNRVFMAGEDWKLGPSLDALDDMLYGGYGALHEAGSVELLWRDIEHSRRALGVETTREYYLDKLAQPDKFDVVRFQAELDALEKGEGETYFDIVMNIIAEHENVRLITESW